MAALLWAGKASVASHRSAAALLKLDGFEPGVVEISAPRQIKSRAGLIVHTASDLTPTDSNSVAGIWVTRPWRTLIDLGAAAEIGDLELALEDALRRGLVSVPYLKKMVARVATKGRRGIAPIRTLLDARSDDYVPTESAMEVVLSRIIRKYKLPEPAKQFRVNIAGRDYRVDFAYPGQLIAIEAQSRRWHSGTRYEERDYARHNALTAAGWRVLYFTWRRMIERPWEVADEIRAALRLSTPALWTP